MRRTKARFPRPAYAIRLTATGYKDAQFVVNASEDSQQEIARLDVRLQRQQSPAGPGTGRAVGQCAACCSAWAFFDSAMIFLQVARTVVRELHVEASAALGDRAQRRAVSHISASGTRACRFCVSSHGIDAFHPAAA
jgi:hypothetical protein